MLDIVLIVTWNSFWVVWLCFGLRFLCKTVKKGCDMKFWSMEKKRGGNQLFVWFFFPAWEGEDNSE